MGWCWLFRLVWYDGYYCLNWLLLVIVLIILDLMVVMVFAVCSGYWFVFGRLNFGWFAMVITVGLGDLFALFDVVCILFSFGLVFVWLLCELCLICYILHFGYCLVVGFIIWVCLLFSLLVCWFALVFVGLVVVFWLW